MKIESKFNVSDEVYFIFNDSIVKKTVGGLSYKSGKFYYDILIVGLHKNQWIEKSEESVFSSLVELCKHYENLLDK